MIKKTFILAAGIMAIGAALVKRRDTAPGYTAPSYTAPGYTAPSYTAPSYTAPSYTAPDYALVPSIDDWVTHNMTETATMTAPMPALPHPATNVQAMLASIRAAEGTAGAGDPYRVCYGYRHTISSMSDHPAITGEWRGEQLSAALCAGAGLGAGCVSTAAGAYQIIKPTWAGIKQRLGLTDFSPASQDAAAVELLRQCGALALVERGDFAGAVQAARKIWASLPGAGYGQGEKSIEWLTARFQGAGGVIA